MLQLLAEQLKDGMEASSEVTLQLTLAAYTKSVLAGLQDQIPKACRQLLLDEVCAQCLLHCWFNAAVNLPAAVLSLSSDVQPDQ